MSLPTACIVCSTKLTRANRASVVDRSLGHEDLCSSCFDYAGWENQHQDNNHEASPDADCPVCNEENIMPAAKIIEAAKTEVAPTVARLYFDHEACDHVSTPAARAKCRREGPAATFRADNGITRLKVVPAQGDAPKVKKAKTKVQASFRQIHAKTNAKILHWAVDTADGIAAACGNVFKQPVEIVGTADAIVCPRCKAMTPPFASA